jgi:uncharacterized protein (DUF1697 family)
MAQYVALLRGINVGGNNIIPMAELKRCFEAQGWLDVATYIQSGNVLFEAGEERPASLSARIEQALLARFKYDARIVLRSHAQMQAVMANAPAGFGSQPDEYRYDVLFLREPVTAAEAMRDLKPKAGVDQAFAGDGVCYVSRLISRASESFVRQIIKAPVYSSITIRNWNTTVKLKTLLDARANS